jgi:hypothetical protein
VAKWTTNTILAGLSNRNTMFSVTTNSQILLGWILVLKHESANLLKSMLEQSLLKRDS